MTVFKVFLAALTLVVISSVAGQAKPGSVEIVFSDSILNRMNALNRFEIRREEVFRKSRIETSRSVGLSNVNRNRFKNTAYGNERLIPDVADYSVLNITEAMAANNFALVDSPEEGHRLRVEIDEIYISNHAIATFNSFNTRMKGRLAIIDENGDVVRDVKIQSYIIPKFSQSLNYDGEEYAYQVRAESERIGPILAAFLEKGIEKLYPDTDVPGPIFVRNF